VRKVVNKKYATIEDLKKQRRIKEKDVSVGGMSFRIKELSSLDRIWISKGATSLDAKMKPTVDAEKSTYLVLKYGLVEPSLKDLSDEDIEEMFKTMGGNILETLILEIHKLSGTFKEMGKVTLNPLLKNSS
jgi:hypothetical protein